ncbi:uncharacterized protein A4U43_C02F8320 [Asparagus officinalis]|uniref:Uncharacterized protein n=1 Tax=Asparagus officinalis TaxID=4686 RepID=A0A5P1FH13_ASPOF|nr:uncharacterized protein A4U43_C02F8320 [Asparagus officinalis]
MGKQGGGVQLGECIKTLIHADYPEQWPSLLHWITCNLQLQDQQVYGALYVLRILSRKYEVITSRESNPTILSCPATILRLCNVCCVAREQSNHPLLSCNNSSALQSFIHALCFSPNRYWLRVATQESVKIWDMETGEQVYCSGSEAN